MFGACWFDIGLRWLGRNLRAGDSQLALYVFKQTTAGGKKVYLVDRIEQPGVDFAAGAPASSRRGVSFEWDGSDPPHSLALVAVDGARTEFEYNGGNYISAAKLVNRPLHGSLLP